MYSSIERIVFTLVDTSKFHFFPLLRWYNNKYTLGNRKRSSYTFFLVIVENTAVQVDSSSSRIMYKDRCKIDIFLCSLFAAETICTKNCIQCIGSSVHMYSCLRPSNIWASHTSTLLSFRKMRHYWAVPTLDKPLLHSSLKLKSTACIRYATSNQPFKIIIV